MTWARTIDLYINVDAVADPLIDPDTDGVRAAPTPILIAGDNLTIKLHLVQWDSGDQEWDTIAIPAGYVLVLGAKPRDTINQDDLIFSCLTFTETGEAGSEVYTGSLDLLTTELQTALGTSASLTARIDIELQDSTNAARASWQFDVTVRQQAYRGDEGEPTSGNPPYPPTQTLLVISYGGSEEITASAITLDLDYTALALDDPPAAILLTIRKPSADAPQIFCNLVGAATATAQTVRLSAPVPDDGDPYYIDYFIIPAAPEEE